MEKLLNTHLFGCCPRNDNGQQTYYDRIDHQWVCESCGKTKDEKKEKTFSVYKAPLHALGGICSARCWERTESFDNQITYEEAEKFCSENEDDRYYPGYVCLIKNRKIFDKNEE